MLGVAGYEHKYIYLCSYTLRHILQQCPQGINGYTTWTCWTSGGTASQRLDPADVTALPESPLQFLQASCGNRCFRPWLSMLYIATPSIDARLSISMAKKIGRRCCDDVS
jgi:hypothetical protein